MFSKGRTYFRFRFHLSRVLLLAFLLNSVKSPTQAFFLPEECVKVLKNPSLAALTNDPKFQMNLKDCMQRIFNGVRQTNWKAVLASIPKELKDLIGKIPNLIEKAVPYTETELVLLSFYLVGKSIELYQNALDLEIDYRRLQIVFPKDELKIIIDSIENDFLPQFKKGNTANIPTTKKLSQMLSRYLKELEDLLQSVDKNVKKGTSYRRWSAAYGSAAVTMCGLSVISGNHVVIIITCSVCMVTAAVSFETYIHTGKTLEKLDSLWKEAAEICEKIKVFLQVPSSQKKQRNQTPTIEPPKPEFGDFIVFLVVCLAFLSLLFLLYVICASVPTEGTEDRQVHYRKIPKISPRAYIFQRSFSRGLFLEEPIFGGAYLRRRFAFQNRLRSGSNAVLVMSSLTLERHWHYIRFRQRTLWNLLKLS